MDKRGLTPLGATLERRFKRRGLDAGGFESAAGLETRVLAECNEAGRHGTTRQRDRKQARGRTALPGFNHLVRCGARRHFRLGFKVPAESCREAAKRMACPEILRLANIRVQHCSYADQQEQT